MAPRPNIKKHNKQQILQSQSGSTCPFPKRITNTYKFATAKTRVQFNFRKRHVPYSQGPMKSMVNSVSLLVPPMTSWYPARCSSCFYPPSVLHQVATSPARLRTARTNHRKSARSVKVSCSNQPPNGFPPLEGFIVRNY